MNLGLPANWFVATRMSSRRFCCKSDAVGGDGPFINGFSGLGLVMQPALCDVDSKIKGWQDERHGVTHVQQALGQLRSLFRRGRSVANPILSENHNFRIVVGGDE